MNQVPEGQFIDVTGVTRRSRRFRDRLRTSIRTKLTVSHIIVVTMSGFIYAAGGFLLMLALLWVSGYTRDDILRNLPVFFSITLFVLFNIFLVTVCGVVAASIASWRFSKRLTRQVDELAMATEEFAQGHLDRRVAVLSEDELGRLAIRFNSLAVRLEELDTQRREFVANVSHDLRTPVAIIRGHLDAQLRGDAADVESAIPAREAFQVIAHEAETLTKLIDDLFTLSRLEDAVLPIELAAVDLAELLEAAVRGIRPYALRQSRVSVNAMISPDLPRVMGDETRINQIVNNLIHNAVRHTPAGGVVVVSADIFISGAMVEITVRDTGVGIAPEELPHIFDRFYQGESTRAPGGTGLGLSIVKQLVDALGGNVSATSTLGEGTAIAIRLPIAR